MTRVSAVSAPRGRAGERQSKGGAWKARGGAGCRSIVCRLVCVAILERVA